MADRRERLSSVLPVVLGGDIGAYALARALNEATGARVTLIGEDPIDAITRSSFIDVRRQAVSASEEDTIATLRELAAGRPERSAVVIANSDALAHMLASHRNELEPTYVVPFPSLEVMDRVSDKAEFARLCEAAGVATPKQVEIALGPDAPAPSTDPADYGLAFPIVAKAAVSSDYELVSFPGKRKIWMIDDAEQLAFLWKSLSSVGYASPFLLQERILGDDSYMRSVTVYMDSTGSLRMAASARVLLEDHNPTLIGNPVAMITEVYPHLWADTERLLSSVGYQGFANLDIKVDPRDGRELFFEVNPRIGRNSYYVSAAGVNPMTLMLEDLILDERGPVQHVNREVLYSLVPEKLIERYITEPALRERVRRLAASSVDPLRNPAEKDLRRKLTIEAQRLNHYRKFKRYYPVPS